MLGQIPRAIKTGPDSSLCCVSKENAVRARRVRCNGHPRRGLKIRCRLDVVIDSGPPAKVSWKPPFVIQLVNEPQRRRCVHHLPQIVGAAEGRAVAAIFSSDHVGGLRQRAVLNSKATPLIFSAFVSTPLFVRKMTNQRASLRAHPSSTWR